MSKEGKDRLEWMIQIDKGISVSDIAKEYNIGKSVIYKWKKIFYEHFMQSLETRSKKPHNIRIRKENIQNIHTDNGTEFAGEFEEYVKELQYTHWYSRVRVSTDNGKCERFNRTVQDEWLRLVGYNKKLEDFNKSLIEYIYYYNTTRPHTSLNYLSPFSFLSNLSTMYSSYTTSCNIIKIMI